jgi:hypothetical protein
MHHPFKIAQPFFGFTVAFTLAKSSRVDVIPMVFLNISYYTDITNTTNPERNIPPCGF